MGQPTCDYKRQAGASTRSPYRSTLPLRWVKTSTRVVPAWQTEESLDTSLHACRAARTTGDRVTSREVRRALPPPSPPWGQPSCARRMRGEDALLSLSRGALQAGATGAYARAMLIAEHRLPPNTGGRLHSSIDAIPCPNTHTDAKPGAEAGRLSDMHSTVAVGRGRGSRGWRPTALAWLPKRCRMGAPAADVPRGHRR